MRKTLISALTVALFGLSAQAQAEMAPAAEASIDWSQFKVTLFDLDPADNIGPLLSWDDEQGSVWAHDYNTWDHVSASDWTSPISASLGAASASADSDFFLVASITGGGYGTSNTYRNGEFTLSAKTLAVFSAPAMAAINGSQGSYAVAQLSVSGPGAFGSGHQNAHSLVDAYDWDWGPVLSDSGILNVSFVNLTNGNLAGQFHASAYAAAPIPEPEAYALLLAGLGLVGWMARRRQA